MENIEAMLCAYVEGDLDAAGRAQIEKHLKTHPEHRQLLEELKATRDLMQELPRSRAPMEVGDALRRQVERQYLLEDNDSRLMGRPIGGPRWPQVLAIAAVILICASLAMIVYKTLGPALQRPQVTMLTPPPVPQPDANAMRDSVTNTLDDRESTSSPLAPAAMAPNAATPPGEQAERKSIGGFGGGGGGAPTTQSDLSAAAGGVDLGAVRQTLAQSGVDLGKYPANSAQPMVLIVDTTDAPKTNYDVAQFLNAEKNGISWNVAGGENSEMNGPTTLPSAGDKLLPLNREQEIAINGFKDNSTTQPSNQIAASAQQVEEQSLAMTRNDVNQRMLFTQQQAYRGPAKMPAIAGTKTVYVTRGMTQQKADELRQALVNNTQGRTITVQQAPPELLQADRETTNFNYILPNYANSAANGSPTTQFSSAATQPADAAKVALGSKALLEDLKDAGGNEAAAANNIAQVDAVIVVEPSAPPPAAAIPATQPSDSTPPTTQPSQ